MRKEPLLQINYSDVKVGQNYKAEEFVQVAIEFTFSQSVGTFEVIGRKSSYYWNVTKFAF